MSETIHLRDVIRQHLRSDQLLGADIWPVVFTKSEVRANVPDSMRAQASAPIGAEVSHPARTDSTACENQLRILDETRVKNCLRCELSAHRTQTVFGQGSPTARLVFVGEGPGYEEDRQGLAFVGPAGQLLTKMIIAMGLSRDDVYICNVVKCRPPGNRTPMAEEMLACQDFLVEQLSIIKPELIVALGAPAAKTLLRTAESIGKLRGRFYPCSLEEGSDSEHTISVMPTYHPAYLLRNPGDKGLVWQDLQLVMAKLGLEKPATD